MQGPHEVRQWATGSEAAVANKDEVVSRVDALTSQIAELTLMMHKVRGSRRTEHINGLRIYYNESIQGENRALRSVVLIAIALGMRKTTAGRSNEMGSPVPIAARSGAMKKADELSKTIKKRKLGSSIGSMLFKKKMIVTRTSLKLSLQIDSEETDSHSRRKNIFGDNINQKVTCIENLLDAKMHNRNEAGRRASRGRKKTSKRTKI